MSGGDRSEIEDFVCKSFVYTFNTINKSHLQISGYTLVVVGVDLDVEHK